MTSCSMNCLSKLPKAPSKQTGKRIYYLRPWETRSTRVAREALGLTYLGVVDSQTTTALIGVGRDPGPSTTTGWYRRLFKNLKEG